jgi:cytochrome d ubiquinol oxidase subunit I
MSVSSISTEQLWFSIGGFLFFYTALLVIEMYLMIKYIRLGPSSLHTGRYPFETKAAAPAL